MAVTFFCTGRWQPLSRPTQDASRLQTGLCTLKYSGSNCRIEVALKTRVTSTDDEGRESIRKFYEDFTAFFALKTSNVTFMNIN